MAAANTVDNFEELSLETLFTLPEYSSMRRLILEKKESTN